MEKYKFTNWTDSSFEGRYGGVPYLFAPGETQSFDPDKHYMLILLSKQLASREMAKRVSNVGRNPNDLITFGKAIDAKGGLVDITVSERRSLMHKAIGNLLDKVIPIPNDQSEEAGTTLSSSQDVKTLQEQVSHLTELVQSLAAEKKVVKQTNGQSETPKEPVVQVVQEKNIAREALVDLAKEQDIAVSETMTKQEIIEALNSRPTATA